MILTTRLKQYIWILIATHLLAAYFSVGFYNLDEQTQVLQLVGYKLGNYDVSYLSDQYASAIRSWFHPAIYLWSSKFLLFFAPFNPFIHAFFYRLLSSIMGVGAIWVLYKSFEDEIKALASEELFFFFSAFLWFFPFLHSRPANENICASLFIFGLYYLKIGKKNIHFFVSGIFFALSFATRFQMAVMIATTVLWFVVFVREYKKYFLLSIGFLLTLGLSTYYDSYMYGHFTFAPYNYFYMNIIQKYASSFGITPFYQYFIYCFRESIPPLAIMTIFSFLYLWIKYPKNLLTWITLPFFIVHSLIGHKEFRFLFPMAPFLILVLIYVFKSFNWDTSKTAKKWFLIFNLPILIYFSFTPAASTNRYFKYLYNRVSTVQKVYVFSAYEDNSKFFLKNDIEYSMIKSEALRDIIIPNTNIYFLTKNIAERDLVLKEKHCRVTFSLYPEWLYEFSFIQKRRTFRSWSFIECVN